MPDAKVALVPKWYWVIAVLAVLWNLIGVTDFYNSVTLNEEYLGQIPGMLEFVKGMPVWVKGAWGLAIVTAVLGSMSLLLRKTWAYPLFIIAFVSMLISFAWQVSSGTMPDVESWVHLFSALIFAIAAFLIWFSRKSKNNGWLN